MELLLMRRIENSTCTNLVIGNIAFTFLMKSIVFEFPQCIRLNEYDWKEIRSCASENNIVDIEINKIDLNSTTEASEVLPSVSVQRNQVMYRNG